MNFQHNFERAAVITFLLLFSFLATHATAQETDLTYPDPQYVFLLREEGALLSSVPERNLSAKVRSSLASEKDVTWEEDINFGTVFRCAKETKSFLEIPDVVIDEPREGFAIAFWAKSRDGNTTMNEFSGLLSHGEGDSKLAISLDNSTVCFGSSKTSCANLEESPEITDKGWHHVTLTTYSEDSEMGYQLYVDGVKYGEFPGIDTKAILDGSSIFLCSSDANGTDIFDGSIVDLVVFNRGLQEEEVVTNYNVRNPFRDSINPGMCSDMAIPGLLTQTSCTEGFDCYMLSLNDIVELTNTHDYDDMVGRLGLCVPEIYTNLLPSHLLVPTPHVFYPLTSNKLESFPMSLYSGSSQGASVVPDRLFGQTLYCNGSDEEYIALDPVAYGVGGGFTINFWFRPDRMSPEGFSWLFSHGSRDNGNDAFGPNQVQIYLSENGNQSDYGHVSAYVRDSNDQYSGIDSTAILNGDGTIGSLVKKAPDGPDDMDDMYDGDWHMVTLTSQRNRDKGYKLYVDGVKVNELSPDTSIETILGEDFQVGGGDMLLMSGNIVLCSRGYGDRYPYHGQIAWLSFWEEALLEEQIELLYESVSQYGVKGAAINPSGQDEVLLDPGIGVEVLLYSKSGKKCLFPSLYQSEAIYGCIQLDGVYKCDVGDGKWEECEDGIVDDATLISARAQPGQLLDPCLISESPQEAENDSPKGCDQGLMCIPTNNSTEIGVCDKAPSAIAEYHIFNWMHIKNLPQPQILYPLLDGSLMAITHPQYTGEQLNVGWVWDDSFRASIPQCSIALSSKINVFTGVTSEKGTMCLWFSAKSLSSNMPYKQVIMSTQDVVPFDVVLQQNGQGKYTINLEVLDKDGEMISQVDMLDSTFLVDTDGTWHLACVTIDSSNSNRSIMDLYLDGQKVANTVLKPEQIDMQRSPVQEMTLCPSLDGSVSQYLYFVEYLNEQQMNSLFSIFEESSIIESPGSSSSEGGLSGGEIAGIVIGSIAGIIILVIVIMIVAKKINRSRPSSFKKFHENASGQEPCRNEFSDREFSYEYDQNDVSRVTPKREFSYKYEENKNQVETGQIMANNPVYGLQTPVLQNDAHMHKDLEDTSSTSSSCAINPTNSASVL